MAGIGWRPTLKQPEGAPTLDRVFGRCYYTDTATKENTMVRLNKAQRQSLLRKWLQDNQSLSYLQFRRTVQPGWDCVMVKWCGMWLGIERDGYTHS